MEENMVIAPNEEIGVEELEENLTGEAEQQQEEENEEWIAGIRQGLGELFEDGWTTGELGAMTQDEAVQREIADGHSVVRAEHDNAQCNAKRQCNSAHKPQQSSGHRPGSGLCPWVT